jgi:hypothetical protein
MCDICCNDNCCNPTCDLVRATRDLYSPLDRIADALEFQVQAASYGADGSRIRCEKGHPLMVVKERDGTRVNVQNPFTLGKPTVPPITKKCFQCNTYHLFHPGDVQ